MPIQMLKAIEILDFIIKVPDNKMPPDLKESLNLAINTMGTVRFIRKGGRWDLQALMPGELPEEEKK